MHRSDWWCRLEKFGSLPKLSQQFYTLRCKGPTMGRLLARVLSRQDEEGQPCFCSLEELQLGRHLLASSADALASVVDSSVFQCRLWLSDTDLYRWLCSELPGLWLLTATGSSCFPVGREPFWILPCMILQVAIRTLSSDPVSLPHKCLV